MNMLFRLIWLILRQKKRSRLNIWETARTPFQVLPTDLDLLGHMNNGKYLSLMDLGRMDLMIRSGLWKRLWKTGWYPVVAAQTISYRKSLNPWKKFDLFSKVIGFSETGVYLEQTFCRKNIIYATAIVRARFLKKKGGTVSTQELEEFLIQIPKSWVVPDWVEEWGARSRQTSKEYQNN